MKKSRIVAAIALGALAMTVMPGDAEAKKPVYKDAGAPIEKRVVDLVGRMTVDEKIGQLLCPMGWEMYRRVDNKVTPSDTFKVLAQRAMAPGSYWAVLRADPWTQRTLANGLDPRMSAEALNALQKEAVENTRLGIPILFAEECAHGHMAIGSTVMPTGLSMASTFDTELIRRAGEAVATETRTKGAHQAYGPVIDLARDPRWSRMEEGFGEDPMLSGAFGAAYVNGLQGDSVGTPGRTVATLKHFAAYGIPQGGLNGAPAEVGKIALFNEHLRPFRDAAAAGTVMTSYNTIDGVPTTGDKELIDGTLRERFGFDGAVTSDLFSIDGITGAGTAGDLAEAAAQALLAGVDIDLGANAYRKGLPEALKHGLVTEADIDRAVANVLRLKMRLGLFENPYVDPDKAAAASADPAHGEIARQIAREGTVLLKNNGILPLDPASLRRVAVIGPNADNAYNQLGDYTAPQPDGHVVTVLEGLCRALPESVKIDYVKGCGIRDTTENEIAQAVALARDADLTVLVVGGSSARDFRTSYEATGAASATQNYVSDMDCGEGFDRATLSLLGLQQQLMDSVLATGRPVVVVYIAGRPLDMNRAAESADALLCAWYPGQEGGNAIADLLLGKAEPSGRLCVTIPRNVGQLPVYYSQRGRHDYTDMSASPLYPFGYGLGYTTFDFGDVTLDSDTMTESGTVTATVPVTNTGARKGVAVVQFYINDRVAEVARAPKELIGFKRVELAPGETRNVSLTLSPVDLAYYHRDLTLKADKGDFTIMAGPDSSTLRGARFTLR